MSEGSPPVPERTQSEGPVGALREWWSTDPVLAIDEALHFLPWKLHPLLFGWWLCDIVDIRLGMTWRQIWQSRREAKLGRRCKGEA